jgi:hypothetical protein
VLGFYQFVNMSEDLLVIHSHTVRVPG